MDLRLLLLTLSCLVSAHSLAFDSVPERRKEQNPTTSAYFVIPLPYSKPGIGEGFVLLGNKANVADTTADLSVILITGDAGGMMLHGEEVPLISDWLSLEFNYQDITRASVNNYSKRGMADADKNDFNILEVGYLKQLDTVLIFNFFDKRLNFYYIRGDGDYRIDAVYDHQGDLIETSNFKGSFKNDAYKAELDFTDDYLDPRKGLRLSLKYADQGSANSNEPDFYTLDYSVLAYVPMGKADTWVFNYYQSDAHVRRIGNVDPTAIRDELGMNCAPTDLECLQAEQELVDGFINSRTYGTAESLGGDLRLRSYPGQRFSGAHSAFLGAEYRWNFTQGTVPFDYFIWKDVRTGVQAAFYAEAATVSETGSDLWKEVRHSVGAGLRLITGSGGVYRAEVAYGREGSEVIVIFDYPWY